ncbi:MAG: hypothetical protein KAS32_03070 [Candidatus Peribacteraceae bacterium]|nr:hypothetical protein [Candidatus Peribacteraceae bacterium]
MSKLNPVIPKMNKQDYINLFVSASHWCLESHAKWKMSYLKDCIKYATDALKYRMNDSYKQHADDFIQEMFDKGVVGEEVELGLPGISLEAWLKQDGIEFKPKGYYVTD